MIKIQDIQKTYEGRPLLHGISFDVAKGKTICLLGPSGSGKSTLLRIIAGLEPLESGSVSWDGQDLASTPPHLRDFGMVFQDYALFPHLDVFDNVAFGLRMKQWPSAKINERVNEVLVIVNLKGFEKRKVTELSGGEQQRVALGRALAPRPRLLMFDEPLGALDRALRESLLAELRNILKRTDIPAIYVTHDQEEAFTIADRVLILHEGQIVRQGRPDEVWAEPKSAWVAEFLGLGNVIEGVVTDGKRRVETKLGKLSLHCAHAHKHRVGEQVSLLVRPFEVEDGNELGGRVADVLFQQERFKVQLDSGLFVYLDQAPKLGTKLTIKIRVECLA